MGLVIEGDGLAVIEKLFVLEVSRRVDPDLIRPLHISFQVEGKLQFLAAGIHPVVGDLGLEGELPADLRKSHICWRIFSGCGFAVLPL